MLWRSWEYCSNTLRKFFSIFTEITMICFSDNPQTAIVRQALHCSCYCQFPPKLGLFFRHISLFSALLHPEQVFWLQWNRHLCFFFWKAEYIQPVFVLVFVSLRMRNVKPVRWNSPQKPADFHFIRDTNIKTSTISKLVKIMPKHYKTWKHGPSVCFSLLGKKSQELFIQ